MIIVVCTGPYRGHKNYNRMRVGPNICKVMNEICFGTAMTQSRIPPEICGVSDPSYIYEIDQDFPSIAPE